MKNVSGFSLIEVLAAMTIVMTLSFIGIPSYKNYMLKGKVMEALTVAEPIKLLVANELMHGSSQATLNNTALHLAPWERPAHSVITDIQIVAGVIQISLDVANFGVAEANAASTLSLHFTPHISVNDLLNWNCSAHTSLVDADKFLPKVCPIATRANTD